MKWIIRTVIVLAALTCGIGVYHWRQLSVKQSLRDEALLYFHEEDYTKSIRYLKKALKKHTLFSGDLDDDMRCYLAESYFRLEEYDKAEVVYDDLIGSDDSNALYYLLKGESCLKREDYDKAAKTFKTGWKMTKDTRFLLKEADIYIREGKFKKALSCIDRGIEADSGNNADFLFQKIIICEKQLDYQGAYEAAEDYIEQYPDDERAKREYIFLSTRI